jgi:hypothetical protein
MSSNWDDFRKELQEKGYLEHGKPGFFLRLGLASITPGRSLLRLGLLSSLMIAFLLSLALTILLSLSQRIPLPQIALYYLPLLFVFALAAYGLLTAVFRLHPLKNPTRSALFFALITAVLSSFLLFKPFHFYLPERVRPFLLILEIALLTLILFPPLKALAFISWREPDFIRYRTPVKVLLALLAVLALGSLIYVFLPATMPAAVQRFPLEPLDKPLAVIAVDGLSDIPDAPYLPGLADLKRQGLRIPLEAGEVMSPAVFWTQVATGFDAEVNGIVSLQAWRLPLISRNLYPLPLAGIFEAVGLARETLASTAERVKPAFWELASWAGRPSACVNWWSSWPPKDPNAAVVSNLFLIQRLKGKTGTECQPIDLCKAPARPAGDVTEGARWDDLSRGYVRRVSANKDLVTAYFPGLDVDLYNSKTLDLKTSLELGPSLRANLAGLDLLLLQLEQQGRRVLLISSSGRQEKPWAWAAFYPKEKKISAPKSARPEDLFPTILKALRLPVPQNIKGHVIPVPWDLPDVSPIPAYPDLAIKSPTSGHPPIEELRSLGYLQ